MPIQYDSRDAVTCLDPGKYQGVLKKIEESVSKRTGKNMAVLTWEVFTSDKSRFIKEYIVIPDAIWKLRKMAQAYGKEQEFSENAFQPEDMIGVNITLVIKVERQEGFDEKNSIGGYEPFARKVTDEKDQMPVGEAKEEIPF